jgi:hypothetical protein
MNGQMWERNDCRLVRCNEKTLVKPDGRQRHHEVLAVREAMAHILANIPAALTCQPHADVRSALLPGDERCD